MVRLTIIGRVKDGMPLAQGLRYKNEEDDSNLSYYKHQAEFVLKEISREALPPSRMTIQIDHQYLFNYLVENGVCFITLCASSYPRKLAFHYLQDLQMELQSFDNGLIDRITTPYSFVKFSSVISNIRKQYIDTRTQTNLSKLNANRRQELDIVTENLSTIIKNRRHSEFLERMVASEKVSSIWCSSRLEIIALRWTPITIVVVVVIVAFWASLTMVGHIFLAS